MVTDVEGSTELWEWDYGVMTLAQEVHDSVMRSLIGRWGPRNPARLTPLPACTFQRVRLRRGCCRSACSCNNTHFPAQSTGRSSDMPGVWLLFDACVLWCAVLPQVLWL